MKTRSYLINLYIRYRYVNCSKILEEANVSADTRVKDLTDDELGRIREVVDGYKVEGDLRREQLKYQTFNGNFIIPWYPSPSWFTSSWSKTKRLKGG